MFMKLCKYCSRIFVLFGAMSIIAPLVIPINVWSLLPWSESVVSFMAALFPIIHALSSVSPMPEVVSTTISMSLIYAVILGSYIQGIMILSIANYWDSAYARIRDGFDRNAKIFVFFSLLFGVYFLGGDAIRAALIDYGYNPNRLPYINFFTPPMGVLSGYRMHGKGLLDDGLTFYIYYAPSSRLALAATAFLEYGFALALFAGWANVIFLLFVIPYQLFRGE
jgi:hypothetical protein